MTEIETNFLTHRGLEMIGLIYDIKKLTFGRYTSPNFPKFRFIELMGPAIKKLVLLLTHAQKKTKKKRSCPFCVLIKPFDKVGLQ